MDGNLESRATGYEDPFVFTVEISKSGEKSY
jgi:hypothetical protein